MHHGSVTHPLIRPALRPYQGVTKTLDVACPYCNAAPTEPCQTVRSAGVTAYGAGDGTFYAQPMNQRSASVKRPHPERVAEAKGRHA